MCMCIHMSFTNFFLDFVVMIYLAYISYLNFFI